MTQDEALAAMQAGSSVFLTGGPGSGKTYTVNRFIAWCIETGVRVAVTASTGIAATHLGGQTIHSWSGIGITRKIYQHHAERASRFVRERVSQASVLVIDEISMLSAATVDNVNEMLQMLRADYQPFGGIQVVFVGDFFQLPPVQERDFDGKAIETKFAFESDAWKELAPRPCYLSEQHRQAEGEFTKALVAIRSDRVTSKHRQLFESRMCSTPPYSVKLFSHNADVDKINEQELARLPGIAQSYKMVTSGLEHLVKALLRGCISPDVLRVKNGALVMFTKNDLSEEGRYVNGSMGTVVEASADSITVDIMSSNKRMTLERAEWSIKDDDDPDVVLAAIRQFPLRLAYAVTVHKAQGMSLDRVHVDLSRAFEYGQGYVALSRARSLDGLTLSGLNEKALKVHPAILRQDAVFRST